MSLSQVLIGVPLTTIVRTQLEAVVETAPDPDTAVGRRYQDYEDTYARLRVFDVGTSKYVEVPTSTQSLAVDKTKVFDIDYIHLQGLSEVYVERMGPVFTLGSSMLYTSGSDARHFIYSGCLLLNKKDGDSFARFQETYEDILRVSKLVSGDQHRYVQLRYRDQIRHGYITSLSAHMISELTNKIDISFAMFVTGEFTT